MSALALVARFNGGMVDGAKLTATLTRFPGATIQINDGWLDVYSDQLPTDHPINVLADVVQVAWERGAIPDARFNEASAAIDDLRERV